MRFAGMQSWQIRWGNDAAVNCALYLRDALALPVLPEIPPLTPPVAVAVPGRVDRAEVAREWPGWWADVLSFHADGPTDPQELYASNPIQPEAPALADRAAIRAALAALPEATMQHSREPRPRRGSPMPGDPSIGDVVRTREAELGRKARPFRLVVTEIPVDGLVWHRVASQHVLVSTQFAADGRRCDTALSEVIAELA